MESFVPNVSVQMPSGNMAGGFYENPILDWGHK